MQVQLLSAPIGDFRQDFINTVGVVVGQSKAAGLIDSAKGFVSNAAASSFEPGGKGYRDVQAAVKPYIIASLALGAFATVLASVGLLRSRRG